MIVVLEDAHWSDEATLDLTGNECADTITTMVNMNDVYLAPGVPAPTGFAGQAGQFSTLYEWFRDILDSTCNLVIFRSPS